MSETTRTARSLGPKAGRPLRRLAEALRAGAQTLNLTEDARSLTKGAAKLKRYGSLGSGVADILQGEVATKKRRSSKRPHGKS